MRNDHIAIQTVDGKAHRFLGTLVAKDEATVPFFRFDNAARLETQAQDFHQGCTHERDHRARLDEWHRP